MGITHVVDLVRGGLVPAGVEAANTRAQVRALVVREFASGDVDAVVDGVDRLDELAVQVEPESLDLGVLLGEAERLGDNVLAKVLVHEAGRAELDLVKAAVAEHLGEAALVVVVAVLGGVVDAADVDDNVGGLDWDASVIGHR